MTRRTGAAAIAVFLVAAFVVIFSNSATCQSIREFTCDIFKCQGFLDLVATTQAIHQDVQNLGTPVIDEARFDRLEAQIAELKKPEASIWIEGAAGAQNDQVTIAIRIRGESLTKIEAWGLQLQFPAAMIRIDAVEAGELMPDWQALDFNETSAGIATIGAYAGGGTPIIGTAVGDLFKIKFTILGTGGTSAAACLYQFVDDLAGYHPDGACGIITIN